MKSKKKLQAMFDQAKNHNEHYTFDCFMADAKSYLKNIKKSNVVCSMKVSRSGMMRTFNFRHYNTLLNVVYNNKVNYDPVKVGGCGMDMHWHLLFSTCEALATRGEIDKFRLNGRCSGQPVL